MTFRKRSCILLLIAISSLFCLSACVSSTEADTPSDHGTSQTTTEISFQEYLWEEHAIDLAIQVGLMLAGALGVAALLPAPDEE